MREIKILLKQIAPYALPIIGCLFSGWGGALLQQKALLEWYPSLSKSPLTPPSIVFPIAWSILYVLIGIAFGAVWNLGAKRRKYLLIGWGVQFVLNFLWSVSFFYGRSPRAGMLVILALCISVISFTLKAYRDSRIAFWCFIPYLLWVAFATYLNLYICLYN